MFRPIVGIIAAASIIAVPFPAQSAPAHASCATVAQHNKYARHVLRHSVGGYGGDFHASHVTHRQLVKLGAIRRCVKYTDHKAYFRMLRFWKTTRKEWARYQYLDDITPYGEWAVPEYIVFRESRHQYNAVNPPPACGGPGCWGTYQIGEDHWSRACAGLGHDPAGQHECAYAILHGRNGYPAEGPGAWGGF